MTRSLLAAAALVLAVAPAFPDDKPAAKADDKAPSVAGKYDCAGEDTDGTAYTATVTIKKKGDAYAVEWELADGQKFVGVGVLTGRTLAVSWVNQRMIGVMAYTVEKDGSLNGTWSALGDPKGRVAKEKLTKKVT
jgi:hypothetical protein